LSFLLSSFADCQGTGLLLRKECPVEGGEVRRLFLYGWVESFLQSDEVPAWVWNAKDLIIEFYIHEDGEKK
jgi:hypothetical protein